MLVLGIESSCDETACSIVEDGQKILSNVISSQIDIQKAFGGVVPELACRRHIDVILPVVNESLEQAGITKNDIDLIAVTTGPGLVGALMIGLNFAKGLAYALDKPLIGVNHIEAHLYACMMSHPDKVAFPSLGVIISGGHTTLIKMEGLGRYTLISQTVDDAIGEAFDKVAKILGLPYPGGPEIERLAKEGDPLRYPFRGGRVKGSPLDFSFSGLKTKVLYAVRGQNNIKPKEPVEPKDIAASFQHAAFSDIISKTLKAVEIHECNSIIVGGGVSNSQTLRKMFAETKAQSKISASIPIFWPERDLSLDNGAMIAGLGYHKFLERERDSGSSSGLELDLDVSARTSW